MHKYYVLSGLCFLGVMLCIGYVLWYVDIGLTTAQIIWPGSTIVFLVGLAGYFKYKADHTTK